MARPRILSGMRPTGALHLGHLTGALDNWVPLQDTYDCFYCIVDWHALTTDYADPSRIRESILEVALDWLAAGLDPKRSALFVQSDVKEHAELHLLLSMVIPVPWLERVPSYKEQQQNLQDKDLSTYGFLGYPLLQSADIAIYKADAVPVGEDQAPHIELTREVVRRFNNFYGPVFPEPQTLLTPTPRMPGTDGRKMSKSYNNAIYLKDPPEVVRAKLKPMVTDPKRDTSLGSGYARGLPGVRPPQGVFAAGQPGVGGGGVPERRHRVSRLQGPPRGSPAGAARRHPRSPRGAGLAARHRLGHAARRGVPGPSRGRGDHGRRARGDEDQVLTT